jgi:hypothetical protein
MGEKLKIDTRKVTKKFSKGCSYFLIYVIFFLLYIGFQWTISIIHMYIFPPMIESSLTPSHILGRHSATWATSSGPLCFYFRLKMTLWLGNIHIKIFFFILLFLHLLTCHMCIHCLDHLPSPYFFSECLQQGYAWSRQPISMNYKLQWWRCV